MVCVDESHGISGSFESIDLLVWVSNQHLGTLLCLDDTDDGCTGREGERGERLEGGGGLKERERERERERAGMDGRERRGVTWGEILCFINQDAVIFGDLWVLQLVQLQVACKI